MKKLIIAAFCLFISVPAMAAGWTNWFTISHIGHGVSETSVGTSNQNGKFFIYPDGTVENLDSCTSSDAYGFAEVNYNNTNQWYAMIQDSIKLATLAYTAGWQVRLYINGCDGATSRPYAKAIEIKKS